jgi:hypothetical protein
LLFSVVRDSYQNTSDLRRRSEHNTDGLILVSRIAPALVATSFGSAAGIAIDPHPAVPSCIPFTRTTEGGRLAAEPVGARAQTAGHSGSRHRRRALPIACTAFAMRCGRPSFRSSSKDTWITDDLTPQRSSRGKELLASPRRPTGVFCVNDDLAAGLLQAGHELGHRIPT